MFQARERLRVRLKNDFFSTQRRLCLKLTQDFCLQLEEDYDQNQKKIMLRTQRKVNVSKLNKRMFKTQRRVRLKLNKGHA